MECRHAHSVSCPADSSFYVSQSKIINGWLEKYASLALYDHRHLCYPGECGLDGSHLVYFRHLLGNRIPADKWNKFCQPDAFPVTRLVIKTSFFKTKTKTLKTEPHDDFRPRLKFREPQPSHLLNQSTEANVS